MSSRILVAYASKRGSTEEVARRIGETLHQQGFPTETIDADRNWDRIDLWASSLPVELGLLRETVEA